MTYATFADVATRFEQPIPSDRQTYVEALIDEAERTLARIVPNLADRLSATPPTLDADTLKIVIVRAVIRTLANPRGYTSETDGSYTYQIRAGVGGDIGFTDSDLALLGVWFARPRVGMIGLSTWMPRTP